MLQRWTKTLLFLAGSITLFSSCEDKFSGDEPLAPVYQPSLLLGSQNQVLYAINPITGKKNWEYFAGTDISTTPLVLGDKIFLSTATNFLFKLDARKGVLLQKVDLKKPMLSSPTGEGNTIYTSAGDSMFAVNADNGEIKWRFSAGDLILSSPMIYRSMILFGCNNGSVYALNQGDGTQKWSFSAGAAVISSPTASGPYIYVGSVNGKMYALDADNGNQRWEYTTGGIIESSPIAYGGNIIFGSNDNILYCVDSAAGKERWKFTTGDRIVSSPYGYQQVVYAGSYDYNFYAINILDGSIKWKYRTNAIIKSSPLVHQGMVYIGSYDKHLYNFDTSGTVNWIYDIDGTIETSPVIDDLTGKSFYPSISGKSIY